MTWHTSTYPTGCYGLTSLGGALWPVYPQAPGVHAVRMQ